uniref:BCAR3 adaptor protein, NSP family member n=1 Tax=Neolamprologus brichardi TaxID=32507 RepID=A0A3Q4IB46_NEOBR
MTFRYCSCCRELLGLTLFYVPFFLTFFFSWTCCTTHQDIPCFHSVCPCVTYCFLQVAENLVQRDGDFLIRDSLSLPGSYVLTCQWRNTAQHFKINKKVVMLNEAYSRVEYRLDREGFDSIPALIRYYVGNRKPVSQVVGAIIFQPINRGLPLRCLEEKHGLSSSHRERLMSQERRNQKRLSLNITNGHTYDNTQAMHDSSQLRLKDRCGSQPASLNQVQERRHPLKPKQLLCNFYGTRVPPGQAIRGSDSQLCPKPPPKPSKVPLASLAHSSCPQARVPSSSSSNLTDTSCVSPRLAAPPQEPRRVETPDSSWASGDAGKDEEKDKRRKKERSSFQRPVIETESMFRPAEFDSRLLPLENKPLEMAVLKRAKELVARILGVTPELKGQMGVSSGLELVTLPHGRQLRLDLMERYISERTNHNLNPHTGVYCEYISFRLFNKIHGISRSSALSYKRVTVAMFKKHLKNPFVQIQPVRMNIALLFFLYLQFKKTSSPPVVCVPLPLPLLTLMERPSIAPDGVELWETSDQGCDIMLRHLEAARNVARNAHGYTANAQKILQGFQCDDDLLEVFKTDFQLRLLWGSRGATVNQSDRYNKFNLILTALSRKLEPPSTTPTII